MEIFRMSRGNWMLRLNSSALSFDKMPSYAYNYDR